MGYGSDCDASVFGCEVSIEPDQDDGKSRFLSLDYSGSFFKKNERSHADPCDDPDVRLF